jgi:DNA-binding MarR family transcriptional regulator
MPSQKDRRQHLIHLTDKARKAIPAIERAVKEIDSEIIEQFSGKDISYNRALLENIGSGLLATPHHPVALNYKKNHK